MPCSGTLAYYVYIATKVEEFVFSATNQRKTLLLSKLKRFQTC